jgi:hypothetical protein
MACWRCNVPIGCSLYGALFMLPLCDFKVLAINLLVI